MGRRNTFKLDVVSIRMVRDSPIYSDKKIENPEAAVELLGEVLRDMDREIVCVVNLKTSGVPINCTFASTGALNYAVANPRELLKSSILSNAANIILVHNHPSGTLVPSKADVSMTQRLQYVCEMVDIPLLDHIIVGGDNREYFSFRERAMLQKTNLSFVSDYKDLDWGEKGNDITGKGKGCR